VRLLLDANLSPRRIGAPLRALGRDVLALAEDVSGPEQFSEYWAQTRELVASHGGLYLARRGEVEPRRDVGSEPPRARDRVPDV
jgi:hypothetical protein